MQLQNRGGENGEDEGIRGETIIKDWVLKSGATAATLKLH